MNAAVDRHALVISPGEHYQAQWAVFCKTLESFTAAMQALSDVTDFDAGDARARADDSITQVFNALVREAERRFAPSGTRLSIETSQLNEKFVHPFTGRGERNWKKFSPAKLWQALEQEYGGTRGAELAYRQAAGAIIDGFYLRQGAAVKRTGPWIVLDHTASVEPRFGSSAMRLTYYASDRLQKSVRGLSAFCEWAGNLAASAGFHQFISVCDTHRDLYSRAKHVVCEDAGVVMYYSRFEFRFSSALAQQLQVFLSKYGTLKEAE